MAARKGRSAPPHGERRLRVAPDPHPPLDSDPATQQLIKDLRKALRADEPFELLALMSSVQHVLELGLVEGMAGPGIELFVETLVGVELAETTAALRVFGAFASEGELRDRIHSALARRRHPLPVWLRELTDTRITRAVEMRDVLGDGEDIVLGITWADGRKASYIVYIDHNAGTVVTDAFPTSAPVEETTDQLRRLSVNEAALVFSDLDLGEARRRVESATDRGEQQGDPYETQTWPAGRPLVRWLLRLMPDDARGMSSGATLPGDGGDGDGDGRPTRDEGEMVEALEDFTASTQAAGMSFAPGSLDSACLATILQFVTTQGSGDLMQWSPTRVEILFRAWLAGRLADAAVAHRIREVARVFIQWGLRHRGMPPGLIRETLEAVDEFAAEYVALATSREAETLRWAVEAYERRAGLQGVLGLTVLENPTAGPWDHLEALQATVDADHFARLVQQVGGSDALLGLSLDPLPDEPFDWAGIPEDARAEVGEVLRLIDAFAEDALGMEYLTACRRFLAAVAAAEPDLFRRGTRADHAAAAVCWTVGKVNGLVAAPGGMPAGELMKRFGLSGSPAGKAQRLVAALGLPRFDATFPALGRPDLLTSDKRRQLRDARDMITERSPEVVDARDHQGHTHR